MQVGKVEGRQQLTERPVTDPAEEGEGPPEAREEAQLKDTHVVTPARDAEGNSPISPGHWPPPRPRLWVLPSLQALGTGVPPQLSLTPDSHAQLPPCQVHPMSNVDLA